MIIKSIKFKNIKSYGNILQEIKFEDNVGELILLTGTNGNGKTTIQESIDLSIFGQVRGKESTKIPLKFFPNRINKNLEVYIEFINSNGDYIKIDRKIAPAGFNVDINNQNFTERFKLMSEEERENLIGFNYNTFKSFISLSMNDFLNFIHLKPEDKRNLLNRLFNLEEIDQYYSITKEIITQNKKEIEKILIEISSLDDDIIYYKNIIKDTVINKVEYTKNELKYKLLDKKKLYTYKENEIKEIINKISEFEINIQECRNSINIIENENIKRRTELTEIKNKIKIHESGICPYCNSNLEGDEHVNIYNELLINNEKYCNLIIDNNNKINFFSENNILLIKQRNILEESLRVLNDEFSHINTELILLKDKFLNYKEDNTNLIDEFNKTGQLLVLNRKNKKERLTYLNNENIDLLKLLKLLGEDGVRKQIISSLIPPINDILVTLLKKINYPYIIKLNDNFDADIYDKGELTNYELLSLGETKMLNLCIVLSYLTVIHKVKNINIIFMDEIFANIHKDNINLLLDLLKNFAKECNIHLITIHQGFEEIDTTKFDRILTVEKKIFSTVKIT